MLEHERFEELASLAAIGELSPEEHEEFLRHKKSCSRCRKIAGETSSVAAVAFVVGGSSNEDPDVESERHRRVMEAVAERLPVVVPIHLSRSQQWIVGASVAAAFVLGIGLRTVVAGHTEHAVSSLGASSHSTVKTPIERPAEVALAQSDAARFQGQVADLQKQIDQTNARNRALLARLSTSDSHAAELEARLDEVEKQYSAQTQEVIKARNELNAARGELSQAQQSISSDQATVDDLRYQLADRETRLSELAASFDRERELLSAGREIRDIMGARDLHIVDIVDTDGRGYTKKPFGRAFYTQGKSLIFYAFDLPTNKTTDGKFVYAAWGSNSNKLDVKVVRSLGIFYNDDRTQHRWAMKFEDPKILGEIDTVFVTLEPAGRAFTTPTGKPILEAYFGTPPNHP